MCAGNRTGDMWERTKTILMELYRKTIMSALTKPQRIMLEHAWRM